ncbi:hypothetical protein [Microcystis sp. 0824]|nr:hypothetical protein [Microcystis sp. 0824]
MRSLISLAVRNPSDTDNPTSSSSGSKLSGALVIPSAEAIVLPSDS